MVVQTTSNNGLLSHSTAIAQGVPGKLIQPVSGARSGFSSIPLKAKALTIASMNIHAGKTDFIFFVFMIFQFKMFISTLFQVFDYPLIRPYILILLSI